MGEAARLEAIDGDLGHGERKQPAGGGLQGIEPGSHQARRAAHSLLCRKAAAKGGRYGVQVVSTGGRQGFTCHVEVRGKRGDWLGEAVWDLVPRFSSRQRPNAAVPRQLAGP